MVNIWLLGDFSDNLDEGYKNVSHYLARGLEGRHAVARLNIKRAGAAEFRRGAAQVRPQIIHAIAQPTFQSLILIHLVRQFWPNARTVVSALRAEGFFLDGKIKHSHQWVMRFARPDLVLVQTPEAAALFRKLGCTVAQLPNGVDLDRFRPVTAERKRQLRQKYGLDPDRPVVLHVGHLQEARNLKALGPLPQAQIQVLVAGSVYMGTNDSLIGQLGDMGFHILKGYQTCVEDLYMLADCYVFPPDPGDSLSMPLSVLEAMACNLPVITMRFAGLVAAFEAGHGLKYVDHTDGLLPHVEAALAAPQPCTRAMVRPYSWQAIVHQLEMYYQGLLN